MSFAHEGTEMGPIKSMTAVQYTKIESPLGPLLLVADDAGLRKILFENGRDYTPPDRAWEQNAQFFKGTISQLRAYFAGELEEFDLQLAPKGTPFQVKVWNHICEINYGETISYGELARRIGNANASRAVGLANGANPIPIIIPCHRVIGSNGKLTGYGGGLPIKERLLGLERRQLRLL
jgi:methylated-DNA-[protein]-cysteine S-methyltransferase